MPRFAAPLPWPGAAYGQAAVFDVTAYGAKGDGKTLDRTAFNKAMATAAALDYRGGAVTQVVCKVAAGSLRWALFTNISWTTYGLSR